MSTSPNQPPKPLYGVNVGGWLVLEKWITPGVFAGTTAADECTLSKELGNHAQSRLDAHRASFITKQDFAWLAERGITAVRIPVGYWIFGDQAPYTGALEYLDAAFGWAEEYNLRVLLDLHGAPGSQNGRDHSGQIGATYWPKHDHMALTLQVLDRLATRYRSSPMLWGIELLNEPDARIGKRKLRQYYVASHQLLRGRGVTEPIIAMSDAYRPRRYSRLLARQKLEGGVMDMHLYQLFSSFDKRRSLYGHIKKAGFTWARRLDTLQKRTPILVGEWSVALSGATFKNMSAEQRRLAQRAYGAAQLMAFEQTVGWFYWTYKTEGGGSWSFRDCVEKDILPSTY